MSALVDVASGDRILITGGSGFIGTNAVADCLNRGATVINLDIKPPRNPEHHSVWKACDILDGPLLDRTIRDFGPDYVVHLAARTDLKETRDIRGYAANTDGVSNLVKTLSRCPTLRRVLFASSRMVCAIGYRPTHEEDYCPPNPYGRSKVITEQIVRAASLDCEWTLVRPTSIWGPWFGIPYKTFFTTIARRAYYHPGSHNPHKSFGFVGNTVFQMQALLSVDRAAVDRRTLYLCDYPPLRLEAWAELIRTEMGLPPIQRIPYGLLKGAALAGDVLAALGWYGVPLTSFRLANLVTEMVYDFEPLREIVGDLPYTLSDGVSMTVEWMRLRDGTA